MKTKACTSLPPLDLLAALVPPEPLSRGLAMFVDFCLQGLFWRYGVLYAPPSFYPSTFHAYLELSLLLHVGAPGPLFLFRSPFLFSEAFFYTVLPCCTYSY